MDPTIVPSTDIPQNLNHYNAFQLPNATGQCALIEMSHERENDISRLFMLLDLVWCKGSFC
jgi:hypothetical protein